MLNAPIGRGLGQKWEITVKAALRSTNTFGIVATLLFTAWCWYYFKYTGGRIEPPKEYLGIFTPQHVWRNLAYVGILYLFIEYVTAALSGITAGASAWARMSSFLNVGISIVPLIMNSIAYAQRAQIGMSAEKAEQLWFCVVLSGLDFAGGLILALLVAQRMIGFGGQSSGG